MNNEPNASAPKKATEPGSIKNIPFKHGRAMAALALFVFFPVGLYLIWRNPRWSMVTKSTWTGSFAVIVVISLLGSETRKKEDLANATHLRQEGDQAKPAVTYNTMLAVVATDKLPHNKAIGDENDAVADDSVVAVGMYSASALAAPPLDSAQHTPKNVTLLELNSAPAKFEGQTLTVRGNLSGTTFQGKGRRRLTLKEARVEVDGTKPRLEGINFAVPNSLTEKLLTGLAPDQCHSVRLTVSVRQEKKGLWFAIVSEIELEKGNEGDAVVPIKTWVDEYMKWDAGKMKLFLAQGEEAKMERNRLDAEYSRATALWDGKLIAGKLIYKGYRNIQTSEKNGKRIVSIVFGHHEYKGNANKYREVYSLWQPFDDVKAWNLPRRTDPDGIEVWVSFRLNHGKRLLQDFKIERVGAPLQQNAVSKPKLAAVQLSEQRKSVVQIQPVRLKYEEIKFEEATANVLTADYFPHRPGLKLVSEGELYLDSNGSTAVVSRCIDEYADGGKILHKIINVGKLIDGKVNWMNKSVPPSEPAERYLLDGGFIKIGRESQGADIRWEPVLKIGAKTDEEWRTVEFNGQMKSTWTVRGFGKLRGREVAVVAMKLSCPEGDGTGFQEIRNTSVYMKGVGKVYGEAYLHKFRTGEFKKTACSWLGNLSDLNIPLEPEP